MTVREYIGARYVPIFSDPIQWDSTSSYEPLTVVMNEGTSYVSKQSVPAGIQITNETYWLRWADYNAQLEEYIRQVQTYSASITALNDALPIANFDANDTVKDAIDAINAVLPIADFDADNTVKDAITALDTSTDTRLDTLEGKFPVQTADIDNGAVTSAKIADGTIATADIANGAITNQKLAARHMVIIGDSYSSTGFTPTEDELWWKLASKQLNLTPHNYAANGCGFIGLNTNTFSNQIDTAYADTNFNNDQVEYVFIVGGLNDVDAANVESIANSTLNQAKQKFPKSKIVFGMIPSWLNTSVKIRDTLTKLYNAAINTNVISIPLTSALIGITSAFDSGNNHPNAYGQRILCNAIMSGLYGKSEVVYRSFNLTANVGTINSGALEIMGNVITLTCVATSSNGQIEINIPYGLCAFIRPYQNLVFYIAGSELGYASVDSANNKIVLHGLRAGSGTYYLGWNLGMLP